MSKPEPILVFLDTNDRSYVNKMVVSRSRTAPRKDSAELEGSLGEVAFAKAYGFPYPVIDDKIRSDGGVDFVLPNGVTVDVKSISGEDHWRLGLLVPKRIRAGIYVLVHVTFTEQEPCSILGYQTGGYAKAKGENRGTHYRLHQRLLLDPTGVTKGQNLSPDL